MRNLYIAYGSNLNIEQMMQRCPTAKVVGAATLHNRKLLFRGGHGNAVATVEPCRGGSVPVLIWEIAPADEASLDRYTTAGEIAQVLGNGHPPFPEGAVACAQVSCEDCWLAWLTTGKVPVPKAE